MTIRIKHGTRTINMIDERRTYMRLQSHFCCCSVAAFHRTSCPHSKAPWHTILVPGIRWPNSCLMCQIGVFWTRQLWTRLLGLPVLMLGPAPPGLSIQDAIKVKTPLPLLYIRCRMRCRILYYMMYIAYYIVYDIVCDFFKFYDVLM